MKQLKLVMNRDTSLVMTQAWYRGHIATWRFFGFDFKDLLFVFDGLSVKSYRGVDSFEKQLPPHFSNWLEETQHQKIFFQTVDYYLKIYSQTRQLKANFDPKALPVKARKIIETIHQFTLEGFKGLLPVFWIPIWQERGLPFPKQVVERCIFIRNVQKEAFFDDLIDTSDFYLELLGKKNRWPKDLVRLVKLEELKQPDFKVVEKRKNGYLYTDEQLFDITELPQVIKDRNYQLIENEISFDGSLKGMPASPGKVKGRVKIVLARSQVGKFNAGDILVASKTTPWYVPLMKQAAAIVTDEGGITSHAAIFSRELNKPCVIATKTATKIFKDGDMVEVDANKGIVRKIDND